MAISLRSSNHARLDMVSYKPHVYVSKYAAPEFIGLHITTDSYRNKRIFTFLVSHAHNDVLRFIKGNIISSQNWSVSTVLHNYLVDIYIYIYKHYIGNNYMFRHFSLAIFRLINEKLSKQLYSTCVCCIQWGGKEVLA